MPHRYFTRELADGRAALTGSDAHHLADVMRARIGEEIVLCGPDGLEYLGMVTAIEPGRVEFSVTDGTTSKAEPDCAVTLFAGYPKAGKLEEVIRHSVELGVTEVVPFFSRYCVATPKKEDVKNERYNRIAAEAAKQAGRAMLPHVALPLNDFAAVCKAFADFDVVLFFYEGGGAPLREVLHPGQYKRVAIVTGSEGGFSVEEAEAMAMALGNVYTFGPTFRAEKSYDTRHAAEFWMIEPEMAFADLNTYLETAEAMTRYVIRYLLDNCPDELAFFNQFFDKGLIERLELVASSDFARVTYTDAIELLKKNNDNFQYKVEWGTDLQTEHERYLTEQIFKKPVFVTDYPKEIKAFYMRQNEDGKTVAAADMLVPGIGELIGGSQREERLDVLEARMKELGLNTADYDWYLDLRRYGSVKHAGYGLGFERLLMYVTGIPNIRDVIPFPRTCGGF